MKISRFAVWVMMILAVSLPNLPVFGPPAQAAAAPAELTSWHLVSINWKDEYQDARPKYVILEDLKADARGGYASVSVRPDSGNCQGQVQRFRFTWRFDEDASRIYLKRPFSVRLAIDGDDNRCLNQNPNMNVRAWGNSFGDLPAFGSESDQQFLFHSYAGHTNVAVRQIVPNNGGYAENGFSIKVGGYNGAGMGFLLNVDYKYQGDAGNQPPPVGPPNPPHQQSCFAADPGAGSTNRNDHYGWAARQDSGHLIGNLNYKLGLLFQCSSLSDDQLASAFANVSVYVAKYVPNAACFNGDRGVLSTNYADHYGWARGRSRQDMLNNLQWKVTAAMRCLDRNAQLAFFADVSVLIARSGS